MYSAVCQCVFLIACAFVGLSTAVGVQGGASEMRTSLAQRLQPFQAPPMTPDRETMNRVLSRVLDMTYELYKELGASREDLKELHHKRGIIQTCYFQAVSCY